MYDYKGSDLSSDAVSSYNKMDPTCLQTMHPFGCRYFFYCKASLDGIFLFLHDDLFEIVHATYSTNHSSMRLLSLLHTSFCTKKRLVVEPCYYNTHKSTINKWSRVQICIVLVLMTTQLLAEPQQRNRSYADLGQQCTQVGNRQR